MLYGASEYGTIPYGDLSSLIETIFYLSLSLEAKAELSTKTSLVAQTLVDFPVLSELESDIISRLFSAVETIYFTNADNRTFLPKETLNSFLSMFKSNIFNAVSNYRMMIFYSQYKRNIFVSLYD